MSMLSLALAHLGFLILSLEAKPKDDNPNYGTLSDHLYFPYLILVLLLTFGQATLSAIYGPAVNKYVPDKQS